MKGIIIFLTIFTLFVIAVLKLIGTTFKAIFRGIGLLLFIIILLSVLGALFLTLIERTIGYVAFLIILFILIRILKK